MLIFTLNRSLHHCLVFDVEGIMYDIDAFYFVLIFATGQSSCVKCPVGQYSDTEGAMFCKPCDPGSSASEEGSETCEECQPGQHQPQSGKQYFSPVAVILAIIKWLVLHHNRFKVCIVFYFITLSLNFDFHCYFMHGPAWYLTESCVRISILCH